VNQSLAICMLSQIPPNTAQQYAPISNAIVSLSSSSFSSLVAGIDNAIKADLDAKHAWYFGWLIAATITVFVGVIFEEAEGWTSPLWRVLPLLEITEYRLTKRLAKLGWILIVVGVMGEGVFEAVLFKIDGIAHTFDETLLADATKQAGDAAQSARIAHEEAGAVKGIADEARADAKDALTNARLAQRELANAESDASKAQAAAAGALDVSKEAQSASVNALAFAGNAQKEADSFEQRINILKMKLDKIAGQLEDREISPLNERLIIGRLTPLPKPAFLVGVYPSDEPKHLANQIIGILVKAGWKPVPGQKAMTLVGGTGVVVEWYANAEEDTKIAGRGLADALNSRGISAKALEKEALPFKNNNVTINVGTNR
jgi:hypothetical protein